MANVCLTRPLSPSPELSARHQANITASLAHRLEKARTERNNQLVALLEQEQIQLETQESVVSATPIAPRKTLWQRFIAKFSQPSAISVERVVDSGSVFWRAYNPRTGETCYAETESEIIDWIEASPYRSHSQSMSGLWGWHGTFLKKTLNAQSF